MLILRQYKVVLQFVLILFVFKGLNAQAGEKMNILFIAVDDLKPTIACFGDSIAVTPNIDALAAQGTIFTKTYCQQAVCAPSRASLMTGRYPDQTKVHDLNTLMREVSPGITSLPQYLVENGYKTTGTGKIFDFRSVDNKADGPSWSDPFRKHNNAMYYDQVNGKPSYYYASQYSKDTIAKLRAKAIALGVDVNDYVKERYHPAVESADVAYDGYVDGAILNVGLEALDELVNSSEPFFLGVGFQRPHLPFVAPKNFWDMYDRDSLPLASFQKRATNSPSLAYHNFDELRSYSDIPSSGALDTAKQKELIHGYYAASSYVDFLVGKLIQKLEDLNLRDNTVIVLWGDHGWHLGDHNLWCKHSNFEEATRVPLLFSVPGQEVTGGVCDSPVEFTDIASTLCELNGVEIPQHFEGESLLPLIEDPSLNIRYGSLSQYPRWGGVMGYSLRNDRFRYTKWIKEDGSVEGRELYDYEIDPLEKISRVNDDTYTLILSEMDSVLMTRISVPSTQTRISFDLHGVMDTGDTVNIGDARVLLHKEISMTDENGDIVFTHYPGSYFYHVKAKGFSKQEGNIEVLGDTIFKVYLSQEKYQVSFEVLQNWNDLPAENVIVSIGGASMETNEMGMASFSEISYNAYEVNVEFSTNRSQAFSNIEIFSDTIISLLLEQPVFKVELEVTDLFSGNAVSGAVALLNGIEKELDYTGKTSFLELSGTYEINLSKPYYEPQQSEVIISKDMLLEFQLEPTHNDVKLWIKSGSSPINMALVTLDTLEITTIGLGLAKFQNLAVGNTYDYQVIREGYEVFSGNFYLHGDTVIDVQLIETAISNSHSGTSLHAWPNPVRDYLMINLPEMGSNSRQLVLHGVDGRMIWTKQAESSGVEVIPVGSLPQGVYCLSYITEGQNFKTIFFKVD